MCRANVELNEAALAQRLLLGAKALVGAAHWFFKRMRRSWTSRKGIRLGCEKCVGDLCGKSERTFPERTPPQNSGSDEEDVGAQEVSLGGARSKAREKMAPPHFWQRLKS